MDEWRGEAGFTIVEVTAGVAIVALAVAGLFAAALTTLSAQTQQSKIERMTNRAQDVATDLRVIGAYDPSALAPLADGAPRSFEGATVTISASGSSYDVVVQTGTAPRSVTVKTRIVQEAPPPGALLTPQPPLAVWSPTPAPVPTAVPQPTPTPCRIVAGPHPLSRAVEAGNGLVPCDPN
jgi:type II secretory pathway pseudopilin PulG